MSYVTQGTVQIHQKQKVPPTIVINPVPDYRVKHGSHEFVVFISDDGNESADARKKSLVFLVSESYEIPDPEIARVLAEAAIKEMNVDVEIEINASGKATVTAVKIPAMTKL